MKRIATVLLAAGLATGFSMNADAAMSRAQKDRQAVCKAQAAKKYTAVHFLKRRAYVKRCMAEKTRA